MLGAILGTAAANGRDKMTIITSPGISDLGAWLEQLIAESTGKQGKGIIPVDREASGPADGLRQRPNIRLPAAGDRAGRCAGRQSRSDRGSRTAGRCEFRSPIFTILVRNSFAGRLRRRSQDRSSASTRSINRTWKQARIVTRDLTTRIREDGIATR